MTCELAAVFLWLGLLVGQTESSKVLIYSPVYGHSHMNFMGKLADILVHGSHDVTLLMPVYDDAKRGQAISRLTKKVIQVDLDERARPFFDRLGGLNSMKKNIWDMKPSVLGLFTVTFDMASMFAYQCDKMFRDGELVDQLRSEKFDLGIAESFFICGHAFFDFLNISTTISADSTISLDTVRSAIGEPATLSYVPGCFSTNTDEMGVAQKAANLVEWLLVNYLLRLTFHAELDIVRDVYVQKTWQELIAKSAFVFVNSNALLNFPQPSLPKTVHIGGMQIPKEGEGQQLASEWEELLSKRSTNVLVSFGSIARSVEMPQDRKEALLEVFQSMPDTTFIWKYEEEGAAVADHLENVVLSSWTPQNALLAHPRLSLFITHGGLGSTMEVAHHGKPAIFIPLMGDQTRNAQMLARHGGALVLKKDELSNVVSMQHAIAKVLHDPSYAENGRRLADLLRNQPRDPADEVLKYCTFAAKYGALKGLDAKSRLQNFFEYFMVDVFAVALICLLSFSFVVFSLFRIAGRTLRVVRSVVWNKMKSE